MTLDDRFVAQAVQNAKFVNLDLDPEARRRAVEDAAAHLRALAAMKPLDSAAANVLRVVMMHEQLWGDRRSFLSGAADALFDLADTTKDAERSETLHVVRTFLMLTDGDRTATVSSDVDGLKGDFAIRGGRVVRLAGDTELPYEHGSAGLIRIMDDGAYEVTTKGA